MANEPRSLPKLQPDQLLVLQLADDAIVDGQPVNVGNEQLAGQEAALIDQGIIRLCDVIFLTTCVGNEGKNPVTFTFLSQSSRELRATSSSTANSAWKTITLAAALALPQCARFSWSHVPPHCCRNYCSGSRPHSQHSQSLVRSLKSRDMLSWVSEVAVYTGRQLGFSSPQMRMTTISSRNMPRDAPSRRKLWPGRTGEPCGGTALWLGVAPAWVGLTPAPATTLHPDSSCLQQHPAYGTRCWRDT